MRKLAVAILVCLTAGMLCAQDNSQNTDPQNEQRRPRMREGGGMGMMGPGGPAFHMPPGAWWKNSEIAQKLNLSDAQTQTLESIFQNSRQQLEGYGTTLRQAEEALKPLVNSEQLNDVAIQAQLDQIAQARLGLEKAMSQMLLNVRKTLTLQQWQTLQSLRPPERLRERMHRNGENPQPPPGELQ